MWRNLSSLLNLPHLKTLPASSMDFLLLVISSFRIRNLCAVRSPAPLNG